MEIQTHYLSLIFRSYGYLWQTSSWMLPLIFTSEEQVQFWRKNHQKLVGKLEFSYISIFQFKLSRYATRKCIVFRNDGQWSPTAPYNSINFFWQCSNLSCVLQRKKFSIEYLCFIWKHNLFWRRGCSLFLFRILFNFHLQVLQFETVHGFALSHYLYIT